MPSAMLFIPGSAWNVQWS